MRKNKLLAVLCGLSLVATSMPVSLAADIDPNAEVSITEEVKEKENTKPESDEEADVETEKETEIKEEKQKKVEVETKEGTKKASDKSSKKAPVERAAIHAQVTYSPSTVTNGDVTVYLEFDGDVKVDGWNNDDYGVGHLIYSQHWSKTFTENTKETVNVDARWAWDDVSPVEVIVNNIDKKAPVLVREPEYLTDSQGIIARITYDEPVSITENKGWVKGDKEGKVWEKFITGNGSETVVAVDAAGNRSEAVEVEYIDRVAPEVYLTNYSSITDTNKEVTVKLYFTENVTVTTEGWKSVDGKKDVWEKTFAENTKETVVAVDESGNECKKELNINMIDKDVPFAEKVEYSTKDFTNKKVVVKITYSEPVDVSTEGYRALDKTNKVWEKEYDENTTETVIASDNAGNKAETVIEIKNIDKTAPKLMGAPLYTPNEMTNGDVVVSLVFDEEVTVHADGWYNDGKPNLWKKVFTKNAEEEVIEVVDLAGNKIKEPVKVVVDNIDKDAPYAMFKTFSTVNPTNKDVTVKVTFNEDVTIAQEGWKSVDGQKDVWEKTFVENAEETVVVKDMVGNEGEVKITIDNIDKQAPDILYTVFSTYEPTKYKVVTTITYSEAVDVSTEGYRPLDDTHTVWQKEYAENTEEVVVAADAAGNVVEKHVSITNIDTKAPSVMNVFYTPGKDKLTNRDVTVAVVFDEVVTVDAEGWYTEGYSNIWKKVFTANGEETIIATDEAGNTVEVDVKVDHIDKTAPVINGVEDGAKYDKEVSATIEDENLSEVILNDQPYDYQGEEIKFTENGVYTLIARDAAGNETKVVFELAIADDNKDNDKNNNKNDNKKDDENKAAKTGDNFNFVIPAVGLLASIAVVVALLRKKLAK